jgi:hypothetical protein
VTDRLDGPSNASRLTRLVKRVEDLERRLQARTAGRPPAAEPLEAVFSHAGTPTTATSARWYPRRTATLSDAIVSLGTAGSSSTVVTVYVNGGSQGTITLGSGVHANSGTFDDVLVADTDYLTVAATTVGTGAADLTVQARLA